MDMAADIKLPFGLNDDIIVHIWRVPQGLACGCVRVWQRKSGNKFPHSKLPPKMTSRPQLSRLDRTQRLW
jgi:hypothetical protein